MYVSISFIIELTQRERVDFHALYQAVTQAKAPEMGHFDAGDMIITEMDHSPVSLSFILSNQYILLVAMSDLV